MALPIPKDVVPGIISIINLPEEVVDQLVKVLTASPIELDSDEMAEHVASNLPSIPFDHLTNIIDALYNLYYIREFSGVRAARFLDDLVDGIREIPDSEHDLQDLNLNTLKLRFEKLLNIGSLYAFSKAARLQRDGERLYVESKILSDIRPVFDADPTIRPYGAVITHTLKIIYHINNEHKEFHVVLDSEDLQFLKETINRAALKDETLRALLKEVKLSNLGA